MARVRPIRIRVEPTLRGLRIADPPAPAPLHGTVVPWLHAPGYMRTLARPVDDTGQPLTIDGRPILARFASEDQCATACRMTKRELRRQWQAHTLDNPMRFEPPTRRDRVLAGSLIACLAAAFLAAGFPMLAGALAPGPAPIRIITITLVILWLVGFPAVFLSVFAWLMIKQSSPVSALHITRDSIAITIPGRQPQRQYWRDLRDRRDTLLLFADGSRVRLPTRDTRLRALYPLLDADILARPEPKVVTPAMFVRLFFVGLILGAGAIWIFHWLIAQGYIPGPLPTGRILFAASMGPALLALGMLDVYGKPALARWINRHTRGMRKRHP